MRLAVLGTGFIANIFMGVVKHVQGMEVTAVLAINAEQGQAFLDQYHIEKYYTDYEALLSDSAIDCVYIGLPNHLHYSFAMQALQASKHVIVEKPFVTSLVQYDSLVACAKEKQLFLFDAITTRHMPNLKKIQENLSRVGKLRLVTASYNQYSSKYTDLLEGKVASVFTLEGAGGALSDLGVYNVTLMVALFGKPQSTQYYPNKISNGIDTSGILMMQYDGFVVSCSQAKDCFCENSIVIQGEQGTIVVDDDSFRFSNARYLRSKTEEENIGVDLAYPGMYYELVDFVSAYQDQAFEQCYQWLEETRIVIEVLKESRNSAGIYFTTDKE